MHTATKPRLRDYLITLFLAVLVYWAFASYQAPAPLPRSSVSIGAATITIELAQTQVERTRGLSRRAALPDGEGMLLIFDTPDRYGIWMPEMRFPIDAVWINAERRVVHITAEILPESYPTIYHPDLPALYILEVPAGTAARHGWRAGDEVEFSSQ